MKWSGGPTHPPAAASSLAEPRARAGGRLWHLRALRQPLYAGIYRVDRTWEGRCAHPIPPDQVQDHRVMDPPLVSLDEFAEVQRLLALLRGTRPARRPPEESARASTPRSAAARCAAARCWW